MKFTLAVCCFLSLFCFGYAHPFKYDLHLTAIPGTNSRTMVCFHGSGSNYQIGEIIKTSQLIDATIISFNFPDYGRVREVTDPKKATFGTIQELLPAFYVLKTCILDKGITAVDLYGFSAGGGAIVNLIAILNTDQYNAELKAIGITEAERLKLLSAIQKGIVILDVPLKSIDEIIAYRGSTPELDYIAKNYRNNHLRPIDSLELLKGLSLNVILYFESPDEVLSNLDDEKYIAKLKQANSLGKTSVLINSAGGHMGFHMPIWELYSRRES